MRSRLFLLVIVLASCASPPGQRRAPTGDWQPLEAGLEWVYEAGGLTQTRRVTGVETIGRFECHVVEAHTGTIVEKYWLRSDRGGLRLFRAFDGIRTIEFDDPLVLIPPSAKPGAMWRFEEHHGPMTLAVVGWYESDEEIEVGGEVVTCARFKLVKRAAGRVVVEQTSWYARDLGLVRLKADVADEAGRTHPALRLVSCNFISAGVEPGAVRRR